MLANFSPIYHHLCLNQLNIYKSIYTEQTPFGWIKKLKEFCEQKVVSENINYSLVSYLQDVKKGAQTNN